LIYLLLSVLSSVCIFILFKLFNRHRVNTLQAIVVNYVTASICGYLFFNEPISITGLFKSSWFAAATGLGVLFIVMFYIMALTAQKHGLSVASVASKMSVVIPVCFGLMVFHEVLSFQKLAGIILALFAVYLASVKKTSGAQIKSAIYLPILVFVGSGIIDTSINYFAPDDKIPLFSALIFTVAAATGLVVLLINYSTKKIPFMLKAIPYGMALGLVNYASIFFLLKALRVDGYDTSTVFTINNVAIVALSTITGLFVFKEAISVKNWYGVSLAMISIILITWAQ
jgi:drug/metabolite transporter (DMT)-like permease